MSSYDDIIDMPHHVSATRRPMPLAARAAQFAPFAALDGHYDAISETARITGRYVGLTEDEQFELSRVIAGVIESGVEALITYFVPDDRKDGGAYAKIRARIRRVDECERSLVLGDGSRVGLDAVLSVTACSVSVN